MIPLGPISRRVLLLSGLLAATRVSGGATPQDPRAFIADFGARALQLVNSPLTQAQRLEGLRDLFRSYFDVDRITTFVLGRYRQLATPQQLYDFSWYYQEYMIRTYGNQLSQLAGAQFVVRGVRPFGAETVVSSEFFLPNGARYQVDWYLIDRGGEYKISDMAIDGVSMKAANRDEVARWIERNGGRFGAVLAVLRQQLGITDY